MNTESSSRSLSIGLIGLLGVVMFSAKSVFAKLAYFHGANPIAVLYLRMLVALPLVLTVTLWYERKHAKDSINWADVARVAAYSVLGYYISAIFNFTGLIYVEASIERLILFLYPTMVIILSAFFLKKPVSAKQIISIVISYAGLVIAFADKLMLKTSELFWFGAFLIFLSGFTYAIFLTASDSLIQRIGSIRFTNIATLTMCVCIIVHAAATGNTQITGFETPVYWNCILMSVLSTVVPVYMFNYAMGKMGATNLSVISCLGPICTLSYSAMLLNEHISLWQIAGTFVVIGGILVMYLTPAPIPVYVRFFRKHIPYRVRYW